MPLRVTMLLPHYPPDVAADGQLFALLARELAARGHTVRVKTFKPRYQGVRANALRRETADGVRVSRCWAPAGKSLVARAFAAWWITTVMFWRALFSRGVLLMPSSPPTLGLVGWWLSWVGRKYVYVLHDVHPELGIVLGRLKPGLVAWLLRFAQRRALARGRVVTLTPGMADKARELQPSANVTVIPNWVDTRAIPPREKSDSAFAGEHGLVDPFVIQYSGNLGLLHPLDGLTLAMKELPECVLCYIGRGARLQHTKELARDLPNVRFFDYQPLATLPDSLAACDLAVIALEPGADRLAMPSKLQGILAAGRPVLALAPPESELARLIEQHQCGWVVGDSEDPIAVATAIRIAMSGNRDQKAQAARQAAEQYTVQKAADAYVQLIPGRTNAGAG